MQDTSGSKRQRNIAKDLTYHLTGHAVNASWVDIGLFKGHFASLLTLLFTLERPEDLGSSLVDMNTDTYHLYAIPCPGLRLPVCV